MVCVLAAARLPSAEARDPTVGFSTRKEAFGKAQEALDPKIRKLTAAATEKERVKLGKRLATKHGRGAQLENLIRYREPGMKHVFVPLLQERKWQIRTRALYGLKRVGDESVLDAVVACLDDKDARVREMAANALCHLAQETPEALRRGHAQEKDRFAKASMAAALEVLDSGAKPYREWQERLVGPEGARRVEWAWTVKGASSFNQYDARTLDYPAAEAFDWPVSWYEGSLFTSVPRKSFGAGGNHAGEDMAWFREGCSYYAVATGLVRMVQGAGGDWGFIVVIEHRLASGEYVCSIYGHAAWDVLVRPGDVVRRGQKIATEGLSCSVENGGYGAHNHFGIAQGPFRRPRGVGQGSQVEVETEGRKRKASVLRLAYDPSRKDRYGFPGLGLVVRLPDGAERLLPAPVGDLAEQVAWLQGGGYVAGCRGWHDPRKFIGARLGSAAK
jgi:murein DD-endopeptidase MepM/ murein hydrolase activator NlpD